MERKPLAVTAPFEAVVIDWLDGAELKARVGASRGRIGVDETSFQKRLNDLDGHVLRGRRARQGVVGGVLQTIRRTVSAYQPWTCGSPIRVASGTFTFGGLKGFDKLQELHTELSAFALKLINKRTHEVWSGIESP